MSELLIGAVALLVAAPMVWALARLALWPFLRPRGRGLPQASTSGNTLGRARPHHGGT